MSNQKAIPHKTRRLSVIIPTLNEAETIECLLESLFPIPDAEIIVSDGGSRDETVQIALQAGVQVLASERGRGHQQHGAAQVASGRVLWFLHADTILTNGPEYAQQIEAALRNQSVVGGHFRPVFEGACATAHFMTAIYDFLTGYGLAYGDSGYFVRTDAYHAVGGFNRLALFEDLDLKSRLRERGKFLRLNRRLVTSSRRFERMMSFRSAFLQWWIIQFLYWFGADPNWLGRLYYPRKCSNTQPRGDAAFRRS